MPLPPSSIWIGFDPREAAAYAVARDTARKWLTAPIPVRGLLLSELQGKGIYTRPIEWRASAADKPVMWDVVSDAPMATEFACSRFLVPHLSRYGWALFFDCDFLVRANLARVFEELNPDKAVYVVKHDYTPNNRAKMDGQIQTNYNRKLWSAFCIFNCDHPANQALTPDYVNSTPGRDLHAFKWLRDEEIGELDHAWHWIPDHSPADMIPKAIHFTEGGPWFSGYESAPYADEWRKAYHEWAA